MMMGFEVAQFGVDFLRCERRRKGFDGNCIFEIGLA